MRRTKRSYKDSLFRDIFNNRERLSEICEALLGLKATPQDITLATIDETLFSGIKNDVGFIVRNEYVLLAEHQSTVNANMPLRLFMYLAEIYRQYVAEDAVYKKESIALPAPKFYVFYNGSTEMPDCWEHHLSDAFGGRKGDMDLTKHQRQTAAPHFRKMPLAQKLQHIRRTGARARQRRWHIRVRHRRGGTILYYE